MKAPCFVCNGKNPRCEVCGEPPRRAVHPMLTEACVAFEREEIAKIWPANVHREVREVEQEMADRIYPVTPARMIKAMLSISSPEVRSVRAKTGMTQPAFAKAFGFPLSTLRQWEQGRREPTGAARTLLTIIDRAPEAVLGALGVENG